MKHLKKFKESSEYKGITIKDPHSMIVGNKYEIIEPNYDDYDEGLSPEVEIVEVIKKTNQVITLKNIQHGFTYNRNYSHLLTCDIKLLYTNENLRLL